MTHLGAAAFGIAALSSLLVFTAAMKADRTIVRPESSGVAEGKSDRLPLPAPELELEAPAPKPVAIERIAPVAELLPAAPLKSRADPVCGPRGRTWYTRENGWRYWRCNR
jgi:hypothetical protein